MEAKLLRITPTEKADIKDATDSSYIFSSFKLDVLEQVNDEQANDYSDYYSDNARRDRCYHVI